MLVPMAAGLEFIKKMRKGLPMPTDILDQQDGVTLTRRIDLWDDGTLLRRVFVVEASGKAMPVFEADNEGAARIGFKNELAAITRAKSN
jgi:hypothetical protein